MLFTLEKRLDESGQALVVNNKRAWNFEYKWSSHSSLSTATQVAQCYTGS